MSKEKDRLREAQSGKVRWKRWGPYLTERQWGTVREDYSPHGSAWEYTTHDMARSKAYRWGEEGIGGISDHHQYLCLAIALWNKKDPIIKERFFGLNGHEGNHGEDVKECYYYLDNTPTHSYMKMLYKYPQQAFPYNLLVEENRRRTRGDSEFELLDTGVFDNDEYFDVYIEHAKASDEDILINITIHNRGITAAALNVLPTIWFRNIWSWGYGDADGFMQEPPRMWADEGVLQISHNKLGTYFLHSEKNSQLLFCNNETNPKRLQSVQQGSVFYKDGINEYLVNGNQYSVNTSLTGTKAAMNFDLLIESGESKLIRLRLSSSSHKEPFADFNEIFTKRITEADEFYDCFSPKMKSEEEKQLQRQAFAGLLWSKQFYYFDVNQWLKGDPSQPALPPDRLKGRNNEWPHLNNADIISMPDKWEFPWYAAWDLAFHCIAFSLIDAEFAKKQLVLLTREWYMHPNGQLPAYEWAFSDVNPPVHAWAAWRVYKIDKKNNDTPDTRFLESVFHKMLLNFTWWVNRKDTNGNNIFQGGFLGLDNIGVFDRNMELPEGGYIEQADGTSWMAMFSLNMMRIALELSKKDSVYEDLATKFFEHFLHIAGAMESMGDDGLWDEEDQFFYDALRLSNNKSITLKVHSMVGLIPLFAIEVLDDDIFKNQKHFVRRLKWFLEYRPDLASLVSRWYEKSTGERHLLSLLRGHRLKQILKRMLDENEFLSEYGIRSLSKFHEEHPYNLKVNDSNFSVKYAPGESEASLFGGNSNWRGPVWMPVNFLIIESLERFYHYYGNNFTVEYPTGSGNFYNLKEIAEDLSKRLCRIFLKNEHGERPVFGSSEKYQRDDNFSNHILFYEYFHGETGRGCGASHQTGWTALIAKLLMGKDDV
ncbi:MAG: glucosidase [Chitinophagales bacterium]|nr:glucosidase [Chitinophagales bacterium]